MLVWQGIIAFADYHSAIFAHKPSEIIYANSLQDFPKGRGRRDCTWNSSEKARAGGWVEFVGLNARVAEWRMSS